MAKPAKLSYILTDIEGTTTPIAFVHTVLFPYSERHLAAYLRDHAHDTVVRDCLGATRQTVLTEDGRALTDAEVAQQLLAWIKQDRKHPALKTLQGLIWRQGYVSGEFLSDIYTDVPLLLAAWHARGLRLGIYSSGSVAAQKLLFAHTPAGDLTPLFSDFFDTAVGAKRERLAYERIAAELERPAAELLFLSDITEELDAAAAAGLATVQLVRPGTKAGTRHATATDFVAVDALLQSGTFRF